MIGVIEIGIILLTVFFVLPFAKAIKRRMEKKSMRRTKR